MKPNTHHTRSLAIILAAVAFAAIPTASLAELPPEAQSAFNKGVLAARQQAWDIAIQNLQDARKLAPDAPEIFYNLGLVESKLPGRELRAAAWFGAYLSAQPSAENSAAVRQLIAQLQVKSESDSARLIATVQDAALQIPYENDGNYTVRRDEALAQVAGLWASVGNAQAAASAAALISPKDFMGEHQSAKNDIADGEVARIKGIAEGGDFEGALTSAAAITDQNESSKARDAIAYAQYEYVNAQLEAGDFAGARRTAETIGQALYRSYAEGKMAEAQARDGDIVGAQASELAAAGAATLVSGGYGQSSAQTSVNDARAAIVNAQLAAGDVPGAQRTADVLVDSGREDYRSKAEYDICIVQLDGGDIAGAERTAKLVADAQLKGYALGKIAEAQAKAADIAGAQGTLLAARRAADLPENASLKTYAEDTIADAENVLAEAQLKAGDAAGARATILLAAQAAGSLPPRERDSSNLKLATVQADAGDVAGAQTTADGMADAGYRYLAEIAIAQAQAKAGDLTGARASLVRAGAAATDPAREANLAIEQAKVGDPAAARASILRAEQAAQSISDAYGRAGTESAIAEAYIKTGDLAAARAALVAAEENARRIADADKEVYLQAGIAEQLVEVGDVAGARASIAVAQKAADPTLRWSQREIADAQLKLGDIREAEKSADLIVDADMWRTTWGDIAEAQGKDRKMALMLAKSLGRHPRARPRQQLVNAAAWTTELKALDKPLFLDRGAYLRALPSDTPRKAFDAFEETARSLVLAQSTIEQMLARQER